MKNDLKPKSVIGSVRLDADVWKAVREMPVSLNQFLREALFKERAKPKNRKERAIEALAASDITARETERRDIEYGHHDDLPDAGRNVASLARPAERVPYPIMRGVR